jgi:hypothetical protein
MTDFLLRLNRLLPRARAWVQNLHAEHASQMAPAADAGFLRLPMYFPASVLQETRVVRVKRVPFPPFSKSGDLPELAMLEAMPIAAITFTDVIFVHAEMTTESTLFHELCHAVQAKTLGVNDYFLSYVVGTVQNGYAKNPFEVTAFDMQSQFDRDVPVDDVVGAVAADALRARAWVAEFFRQHGVPMGG